MNDDPIRSLIDAAIDYVLEQDPQWNQYQPRCFRAKVVEVWKSAIQVEIVFNAAVCWSLRLGDKRIEAWSGLFHKGDRRYNPYLP